MNTELVHDADSISIRLRSAIPNQIITAAAVAAVKHNYGGTVSQIASKPAAAA